MTISGVRGARAGRNRARRLATLLAVALLAPLLVAVAGPASPAAAVVEPQPIPDGLWDTTPSVGSGQTYVALDGDPGDYVSGGDDHLYTKADAAIAVSEANGQLRVTVNGFQRWDGRFSLPDFSSLQVGFYPTAWVQWSGEGRWCGDQATTWLAVDAIQRSAGGVDSVTLRFGQTCSGSTSELRGKVRWIAADPTAAPGPAPIPDGLWDTAPAVDPSQSYMAVDGSTGDGQTNGADSLVTQADAQFHVGADSGAISVETVGDRTQDLLFRMPSSVTTPTVGYYGELVADSNNPTRVNASMNLGYGTCSAPSGWLAIDSLTVTAGVLTDLTLRTEYHCDGGPPVRMKLRWSSADTTGPPGPEVPVPEGLWDTTPAVGAGQSYVALESTTGFPSLVGTSALHTKADAGLALTETRGVLGVVVNDGARSSGSFRAMAPYTGLDVGYYADARNVTGGNPTRPGVEWVRVNGCTTTGGWVAVDAIQRGQSGITSMTLRFEQQCGDQVLHGKIRWSSSDTTVPPGPQNPIPSGLWDTDPAVPEGTSYLALEGGTGDPWLDGGRRLFTSAYSTLSVVDEQLDGEPARLALFLNGDERWTARWQPMSSLQALEVGYYPDTTDMWNPAGGQMSLYGPSSCHITPTEGWMAVDEVTRVAGVTTSVTLRFEQTCEGSAPIHGKLHWRASDPGTTPGPDDIPGDLWDVQPPLGPTQSYAVMSAPAGEPVSGGIDRTFTNADSRITLAESGRTLSLQVRAEQTWVGTFVGMNSIDALQVGYYPAVHAPAVNPRRASMSWAPSTSGATCADGSGWYAVDEVTRTPNGVTAATIRFGFSCDGVHTLNGKVRWDASDITVAPGPVVPVPDGLWDEAPPGVSGDYFWVQGAAGDPVSGGLDVVAQDHQHPGVPVDWEKKIVSLIGTGDPSDFWSAEFDGVDDQGLIHAGYYPNLSSVTAPNPVLGGLDVRHYTTEKQCTGTTTGWYAVDRIGRIDGQINLLELRFEQSCNGNPPMHGRLHFDAGGLEEGPPVGELGSAAPVTGGVQVDGWALDPETASPIDVDVLVDGAVKTTLTASGDRPDVGAANPLYGNGHGFSATVSVPTGTHRVCTKARNTGVGADTVIGCKSVTVGAGSPFGSFDVASAGPASVNVAGWTIDPDTSLPIPVHVYVDSKGVALTADTSRPDVAAAVPGYGPAHGFATQLSAGPGPHTVCAYGINVGVGGNVLLGCRSVVVPSGSPVGSLDLASAGPGMVTAAGWALDWDSGDPISVHVYVDGVGVAVTANGSRPDVGAAFPGWGPGHGFSAQVRMGPGPHTVCAYGINVGPGANSLIACRPVVVPGGSPFGALDVVVGGTGQVTVAGWAIDPDTSASIPVHVYVGPVGTALTANGTRNDVAAAFPGYGASHGFGSTITATPGTRQVCAYGINVGVGANTLIGCRIVTVG